MTQPLRTLDLRGDPDRDLGPVVDHLRNDGVVGYPTETVYGLGSACTEVGMRALQMVKGRSEEKSFIALVASRESIAGLAWTEEASELADIFWPGSVTLVLGDPDGTFPPGVRDPASGGVAVRVSPHPVVQRLLSAFGGAITSTSLNISGSLPAASGAEAREVLETIGADDVWLLDVGTLPESGPSTVIDFMGPVPIVLREGTVPIERIRCAIPDIYGQSSN